MVRIQFLFVACCGLTGCASLGPLNPMRPLERKLVFQPTEAQIPDDSRDFVSVRIPVANSQPIHGLMLEHPSPQGILLFCHGNAGNIVDRLPRLKQLRRDHSITVLGFDYRGYGASEGTPGEAGLYQDARAARKWLAEHCGVDEREIIIMGRSLGGAVAVELAASDGAKGLILESTFTSIPDVGKAHTKWLPVSLLVSQKFDSINKIGEYHGPLLQSHGTRDDVVPFQLGQRLYKQANGPKNFYTANGGHNDRLPEEYDQRLGHFLASLNAPLPKLPDYKARVQSPEFDCQPNSVKATHDGIRGVGLAGSEPGDVTP